MHCYLLESTDKRRTYIGATVDVERRLDQHNRKLAGGAKATAGRTWRRVLYVSGFPSWPDTLSFEWAWKYYSKEKGVAGRIKGLQHLLTMDQCTSNATPFRLWCQNFSVCVSTWALPELKKIETWSCLTSKWGVLSQSNSFHTFKLLSFFPSLKMSVSAAQFQQLQVTVDALKADVKSLNERLAAALGAAPVVATGAPEAKQKRGRKPKAAAEPKVDEAPVAAEPPAAEGKKPRKKRETKEKPTCPTAAEGVVRFAGCADKNEYKVFNNMYRSPFNVDGKEFPTVAHYLAYKKYETVDQEYADKMLAQKNPALLTGMLKSKDHKCRDDWEFDSTKGELLSAALNAKFKNAELRATLLKTDGKRIEFESATDSFFGIGADGLGNNLLGKSLVALRTSLA